jgi:hypothetical protein
LNNKRNRQKPWEEARSDLFKVEVKAPEKEKAGLGLSREYNIGIIAEVGECKIRNQACYCLIGR